MSEQSFYLEENMIKVFVKNGKVQLNESYLHINTEIYERSHGKKPSGSGNWGFEFKKHGKTIEDENGESVWWARELWGSNMPLSKALELAKKEAKERNADEIVVLP